MNGHRIISNYGKYIIFDVRRECISNDRVRTVPEYFLTSGMRMMTITRCVDGAINCDSHDTYTAHEKHMGINSARESTKLVDRVIEKIQGFGVMIAKMEVEAD